MSIRYERMNEEIKKTISEIIKDMKDPRVSDMTTIMSVDVTNDLKQAKVLVSVTTRTTRYAGARWRRSTTAAAS